MTATDLPDRGKSSTGKGQSPIIRPSRRGRLRRGLAPVNNDISGPKLYKSCIKFYLCANYDDESNINRPQISICFY